MVSWLAWRVNVVDYEPARLARTFDHPVKRLPQFVLIGSAVLASWLGMQAVHEGGHVCGALFTGAEVGTVVLHPLAISRTDLCTNPKPLLVVWAGPMIGVLCPLLVWAILESAKLSFSFLARFFAGFCLIANGVYIAFGSLDRIGDCGEMLKHGSSLWHLWLFGAVTIPVGFWLWHRQGLHFGLGKANGNVNPHIAYSTLAIALCLVLLGLQFPS
jgi:hypothetical protein